MTNVIVNGHILENHKNTTYIFKILFLFVIVILIFTSIFSEKINNYFGSDTLLINKLNVSWPVLENNKNHLINPKCNFFTCFNVYQCGNHGDQLLVYVYPQKNFKEKNKKFVSKEYYIILKTIIESKYYTNNPHEACIFIFSLDMLQIRDSNQQIVHNLDILKLSKNGKNSLVFNFELDDLKTSHIYNTDLISQAMFAGIGFTKTVFRKNFDISLPIISSFHRNIKPSSNIPRKWFALSTQLNIDYNIKLQLKELKNLFPNELQIISSCEDKNISIQYRCVNNNTYEYPKILQYSRFCLVLKGEKLGLTLILEALANQCVPIIMFDNIIMPFDEVIDWSRAAIFVRERDLSFLISILKKLSYQKIEEIKNHGTWLYHKYFNSIKIITETTLDIISHRIFRHSAKNYYYWNEPNYKELGSPVYVRSTIPKTEGFTAVILTYDRIELLFSLINKLSKVDNLAKIIIVWNNIYKNPPRLSRWPKTHKLIKVIQMEKNVLSNRFYPFDEIETEAILSIDDDIIMLTEDEIEFAFEVWREFPDRIVGFPSRTHTWDNKTFCWKYESEWTNHISMVLTGAAFYHKYWNYVYTTKLPQNIRKWIDDHMNCEDIAMNFLVANITKKAPIKVTAKKKFRCPECINTGMLSADLTHMIERTQCINYFVKTFHRMPLKSVEFRADPVLFKDYFPDKLKRFNNVGSL